MEFNTIEIKVTSEDHELLTQLATKEYREPEQQASAIVHAVLNGYRPRATEGNGANGTNGVIHRTRRPRGVPSSA